MVNATESFNKKTTIFTHTAKATERDCKEFLGIIYTYQTVYHHAEIISHWSELNDEKLLNKGIHWFLTLDQVEVSSTAVV